MRRSMRDKERTHEEVVCVRIRATDLEQLHQVVELAVYVAAYRDGAFLCSCERRLAS
jgi:hypothetical protein